MPFFREDLRKEEERGGALFLRKIQNIHPCCGAELAGLGGSPDGRIELSPAQPSLTD